MPKASSSWWVWWAVADVCMVNLAEAPHIRVPAPNVPEGCLFPENGDEQLGAGYTLGTGCPGGVIAQGVVQIGPGKRGNPLLDAVPHLGE
jgi:hypothetical protein